MFPFNTNYLSSTRINRSNQSLDGALNGLISVSLMILPSIQRPLWIVRRNYLLARSFRGFQVAVNEPQETVRVRPHHGRNSASFNQRIPVPRSSRVNDHRELSVSIGSGIKKISQSITCYSFVVKNKFSIRYDTIESSIARWRRSNIVHLVQEGETKRIRERIESIQNHMRSRRRRRNKSKRHRLQFILLLKNSMKAASFRSSGRESFCLFFFYLCIVSYVQCIHHFIFHKRSEDLCTNVEIRDAKSYA